MNSGQARLILGVERGASPEEIKVAYRRLALEAHPDKAKADDGGRRFQKINEAYDTLKHGIPESEEAPRNSGHTAQHTRRPNQRPENPPEQDWSKYTSEFEDENPDFWREYERKFWQEYNSTINADGKNGEHEKTREPRVQPHLFVQVDPSLCIACQSCETIAPSVFEIDRKTNMNPKSRVINMAGAGLNKIMNAAETCPTKAIIVEDSDKKARLYPL